MVWELAQAAPSGTGDTIIRVVNTIANTAQVVALAYIGAKFARSAGNGGIPVETQTERSTERVRRERVRHEEDDEEVNSDYLDKSDSSKNTGA